jgi:hypothetical protein
MEVQKILQEVDIFVADHEDEIIILKISSIFIHLPEKTIDLE